MYRSSPFSSSLTAHSAHGGESAYARVYFVPALVGKGASTSTQALSACLADAWPREATLGIHGASDSYASPGGRERRPNWPAVTLLTLTATNLTAVTQR